MDWVSVTYPLLWLVVVALAAAVAALARQIGLLHERLPPMGALLNPEGPAVGELAPALRLAASGGREFQLGTPRMEARPLLLLFVSSACPVCKRILPWARLFARTEKVDLVLLADSEMSAAEGQLRELAGPETPLVGDSSQAAVAFRVGKLPYAVMIDAAGRVAAKGLVNSREHLESLIVSTEIGFPSIQAFLTSTTGRATHGN